MFYWSDHFPKKYWFWLTLWWKRLELYLRKNMTLFEEIQGIQLLFLESLQHQLSDARTKGGFSVEISFTKIKFPIETLFEAKKRLSSRGTGFPLTKGLEIKKTIWIHWSIRRWNQNKMFFKWTNLNAFETFGGGLELGHEHYSYGAKPIWLSDVIRSFSFLRTTEPSKFLYKDPNTGCFNRFLT